MLSFAICEINGKQYKVEPKKEFLVDLLDGKEIEAPQLLRVEDGRVQLGTPYLKEKIKLQVLEEVRGKKIRVAKYQAKANYRKVKGQRSRYSKVVLKS